MAWLREYNSGQKASGEVWAIVAGRPDATNDLTWASTRLWNGIVWVREAKSASIWTKEI